MKCICIAPPYNTNNNGWDYKDNVNSPVIRQEETQRFCLTSPGCAGIFEWKLNP